MEFHTRLMLVLVILILVSSGSTRFCAFGADASDAGTAIAAAKDRVVFCYDEVTKADSVGANVLVLLATLNEAENILSQAELSYEEGDFDSAVSSATHCREMLNGFADEAKAMAEAAVHENNSNFMIMMVWTIVATVAIVCGSFAVWRFSKKRNQGGSKVSWEYRRVVFMIFTTILVLIVASPALNELLVHPRTEFFTELWILDNNHRTQDYPFNITRNQNYRVFLGIQNRLGYCAYYLVEVKFRNQTQSAPDNFNHTPSSLKPLFNFTAFVSDEDIWEIPLTFSFDYKYNEMLSQIEFYNVTLNDVALDMKNNSVTWNSMKNEFRGDLFFELWIYDRAIGNFHFHERFVNLGLNITI